MTAGRGLNSVIKGMQIKAVIIQKFFSCLSFPEGGIIFLYCTHFLHILLKKINIHVRVASFFFFFWQGEVLVQENKPVGDTDA